MTAEIHNMTSKPHLFNDRDNRLESKWFDELKKNFDMQEFGIRKALGPDFENKLEEDSNKYQKTQLYMDDINFFYDLNDRLSKEIRGCQKQLGADSFTKELIANAAKDSAYQNDLKLISMVVEGKNNLLPALEGFDKKIGSYKSVFEAFIAAGDEVRSDLFKMFEKNKELRQRLAQKEQKLQEYMNNGPMGKRGMAQRLDMFNDLKYKGDKSKEIYDYLKSIQDAKEFKLKSSSTRLSDVNHKLEHLKDQKKKLEQKIALSEKEIESRRAD